MKKIGRNKEGRKWKKIERKKNEVKEIRKENIKEYN